MPGEKTIFFDDFTDMAAGDAPPHFKVRGPAMELRAGGDVCQLTAVQTGSLFPKHHEPPEELHLRGGGAFENLRNARTALILYSSNKEILIWWIYADP